MNMQQEGTNTGKISGQGITDPTPVEEITEIITVRVVAVIPAVETTTEAGITEITTTAILKKDINKYQNLFIRPWLSLETSGFFILKQ